MADEVAETYSIHIPAGNYWDLPFAVSDVRGFYIAEVTVEQKRQVLDDVGIYVMDEDNFKLWVNRLIAIQAGARPGGLPQFLTFSLGKLSWGTISFRPTSPGTYRIVLDNTHSTYTSKDITLRVYSVWREWSAQRLVEESLRRLGWTKVLNLFELCVKDIEEKRLSNSCDNMRKALVLLWAKVCESLSKKPIIFDVSKSPDIGMLKEKLGPYAPEYVIGQLSHVWSVASELAHIEKRGGKEPPLNEVIYAIRLVYSSAAFLVSLHPPAEG